MNLQRNPSTYGRLVPKPEGDEKPVVIDDTPIPIQDQIENLRIKISLKERYNKVAFEDVEEIRLGTISVLRDLNAETRDLRWVLIDALNAEKTVVQHALRTQRYWQLATRNMKSSVAIPWLNDKLFDIMKKYNARLNDLNVKRKKLEESEELVIMIEKWPRPGTLPWEIDTRIEIQRLENLTENMKVKLETSSILHSKYYDIKFILREEGRKYAGILKLLDAQFTGHQSELLGLQKMLKDATIFRDDAERLLHIVEKEASENHKERRRRMLAIKGAVERLLGENAHTGRAGRHVRTGILYDDLNLVEPLEVTQSRLRMRREKIGDLQDKVQKFLDTLRVDNITNVSARLATVNYLNEKLQQEIKVKDEHRDMLLRQKAQLTLIYNYIHFSGQKLEERFQQRCDEFEEKMSHVQSDIEASTKQLHANGTTIAEVRLIVMSILNQMEEQGTSKSHFSDSDLKIQLKRLYYRIIKLVNRVSELEEKFEEEPERDYASLINIPPTPVRLLRVGSPVVSDDSEDDDLPDMKIPTREDIKQRSQRFIQQAILRRGLQ